MLLALASPYQKEEKLNNDINYKQTNNLENLNINKQELSLNDYLEFNNKYIEKINGVANAHQLILDNKNNVYFTDNTNVFILKNGENTVTKIKGIELTINGIKTYDVKQILFDKNYYIYIITENGLFVLKQGEIIATKINYTTSLESTYLLDISERINKIVFDKNNNVYIATDKGIYFLKNNEKTATKVNGINWHVSFIAIDSNDNLYIEQYNNIYKWKNNEEIVTKIIDEKEIIEKTNINFNYDNYINYFSIDSNNDIYFTTVKDGLFFLKNNDNKILIKNLFNKKINFIKNDNKNNIYVNAESNNYKLVFNFNKFEENELKTIEIIGIKENINQIIFDNQNNTYFEAESGLYFLGYNETKAIKIIKIPVFYVQIYKNNDVYFLTLDKGSFLIKNKNTIPIIKINNTENINTKLSIIFDDKNTAYFVQKYKGYILKQGEINPIKINNMNSINNVDGIDKNNNIYFSGGQGYTQSRAYILKQGETNASKISEANFSHFLDNTYYIIIDNNKNIYFSTVGNNSGHYVIKNNETQIKKITGIKGNVINSIISDSKNNSYFWTNGYKGAQYIKNNENIVNSINGLSDYVYIRSIKIDNKDNVYFGTDNGAYVLKQGQTTAALIDGINSVVYSIFVSNKKDIYIILNDGKIFFLNYSIEKKSNIKIIGKIDERESWYALNLEKFIFVIDNNNNIYFRKNDGLYKNNSNLKKIKKIFNGNINNIFLDKSNNIYFSTNESLYKINSKLLINAILKINNLEEIKDNSDETILNILNYLNRENNYFLNLNKMKVINKTPTSATIEAIKGKYRGQVTVNYKIKNKDEISNIDLNDLLNKAIYFDFIDKNFYSIDKIKEIKEINSNNLNFGNVEVTRDSRLSHSVDFKVECFKKTFTNHFSYIQKRKVPKCEYSTKSKIVFQIITGLTKTNQENKLNGWNINIDDEIKLSDFININNKDSEIINTLSDNFDLLNTNKQEQEMILQPFNEDDYEISVDPKTKLGIKYSVREINIETILILKQKITGTISHFYW